MQPLLVVVAPPQAQPNLGIQHAEQNFPVQKLVPKTRNETLGNAILPRFSGLDVRAVEAVAVT